MRECQSEYKHSTVNMYQYPQYALYGAVPGFNQAWMANPNKPDPQFAEPALVKAEVKKPKKRNSFTIDSILGNTNDEKNDSGFEENVSPTGFNNEGKKTFTYQAKACPDAAPVDMHIAHYQQTASPYHTRLRDNAMLFCQNYGFPHPIHQINKVEDYSNPMNPSSDKYRRSRTIFTTSQLEKLEAIFEKQHYMVGSDRCQLAEEMNLSEAQVKVWFQNRRIKLRKQNKMKKSNESSVEVEDS